MLGNDYFTSPGTHFSFPTEQAEINVTIEEIKSLIFNHPSTGDIDPTLLSLAIRELLLNAIEHYNHIHSQAFTDLTLVFSDDHLFSKTKLPDGFEIRKQGLPLIKAII